MPTRITPKPSTDTLHAIGDRLLEYTTCIRFAEWLAENNVLVADTAIDTSPEALAYGFAIRFMGREAELEKIIGGGA